MTSPVSEFPIFNFAKNPHGTVIISVEAAIGTGKSSLLRMIEQRFGKRWLVVQEPVEEWQNIGPEGHNLLQAYYEDQSRFAFSFQTHCVMSRIESVERVMAQMSPATEVIVLERCWHSDRNTFGQMLKEQGKISSLEWALYDQWYNFAVRNSPTVEGFVYLECATETSMNRLRKRSRSEETGITAEYQKALIEKHEQWLQQLPDQERIMTINVDHEFISDEEHASRVVAGIEKFVNRLREKRGASPSRSPLMVPSEGVSSEETSPEKNEEGNKAVPVCQAA